MQATLNAEQELIWLAGLLEGEGSFGLHKQGKYEYPYIKLGMTDADVVGRAKEAMGVTMTTYVYKKENRKDLYNISLPGERAIVLMRKLYMYMHGRKRERIAELIRKFS